MNSETFIDKSSRSIQKNNPTKTASICLPNPIQYASQVSKENLLHDLQTYILKIVS